jgi:hypothetical protein
MTAYDEDELADLLAALPAAPGGWMRAAKELPAARAELDSLVARAEADAAFRDALLADLERALAESGIEPTGAVVESLRRRLSE